MDAASLLQRLDTLAINPFLDFLSVCSFLLGVLFIIQGLLKMARFSERKSESAGKILGCFVLGTVLISLPATMDVMTQTLFGHTSTVYRYPSLAYTTGERTVDESFSRGVQWFFRAAFVMGWVAFFRGWVVLKAALQGRSHATFSGGITHIVGGVFCVNLSSVVDALQQTLGFKFFN